MAYWAKKPCTTRRTLVGEPDACATLDPSHGESLFLSCPWRVSAPGNNSDIQNLVNSGRLEGLRWPNFSDYRASLQEFYEPTGYAPAWVREAQPVPQVLSLIERFTNAGKKGLDPEDYDASQWEERIRSLQGSSSASAVSHPD